MSARLRRYGSRFILVSLAAAPFLLVAYSLLSGRQPDYPVLGVALVVVALAVAALNAHLSWVRPLLFRWRHGSMAEYRFISGFPVVGTVFVVLAVVAAFGSTAVAILALLSLFLDTGGLLWFAAVVWKDPAFSGPAQSSAG